MAPLQQHVAFFDRDNDGIIWPQDTNIQFGVFLSLVAMCIIHGGFSYVTWGSIIPDPYFRLNIKYMHRASDFDNERFNKIFDMYSAAPHTHLTFSQGMRMLHGNMNPFDPATFEWLATYLMLWPSDSRGISKEDIVGVYDGSIFYKLSNRKPKY
ncbi:Caleosin [Gymnopilus junonius]|uniref:Caleosin n=1 Tax=Gymnopilus junonius TaxID=109634 RepID=A0A9P5NUZ9_GYMJU|nr:Caleosin [Gymnopilus junonius]